MLKDGEKVQLDTGKTCIVTTDDDVIGTAERFSLDYKPLPTEVQPGTVILIDDGLIGLEVDHVEGTDIHCRITNGGLLGEHKGVNFPNLNINLPSVTAQDRADIMFGCELGIDASPRPSSATARPWRRSARSAWRWARPTSSSSPRSRAPSASRTSTRSCTCPTAAWWPAATSAWRCPPRRSRTSRRTIIKKCKQHYKPVITATQMLDSMQRNPRPTRAEVNDVANAVYDGTDCVMLSGETAAGKYPIEAVKTMSEICKETEKYLPERREYFDRGGVRNVNGATGFAALEMADHVGAKCILAPTNSGRSARLISHLPSEDAALRDVPQREDHPSHLLLLGRLRLPHHRAGLALSTLYDALTTAKRNGLVDTGDIVVITAGDPQTSPRLGDYTTSTNMAMVAQVQ